MKRYRIALIRWHTVFGEVMETPSVQQRIAFFWWVTLTHCESVTQAKTYINNIKKKKPEKVIRVIIK